MASSFTLQGVVDYARTFSELTPVLSVGGMTQQPALSIAQDVLAKMLSPTMPWKWNRVNVPTFPTNAYQQDYGVPGVSNIKWLENATWTDINNTSARKPVAPIEAVRDLQPTSTLYTPPTQICWIPNREMQFGPWPGASVKIANPIGVAQTPQNPITQFIDANGNLLVLTTYGTTGSFQPSAVANATPGTAVVDGTCGWTVLDPDGQGFRLNCVPTFGSLTYQIAVVAQARAQLFSSLSAKLDPIPDDIAPLFRKGFVVHCLLHSPEQAVRARFAQQFQLWMEELSVAIGASNRERTEYGFYPAAPLQETGIYVGPLGPSNPYGWY